MTEDNSPILDYASPRKRVRFRLPANSTLIVQGDKEHLLITEKLTGDNGAIPAMLFAGFVLVFTSATLSPFMGHRVYLDEIIFWIIQASLQIFVMVLLIQQTWRKTILTIRYAEFLLKFSSPLRNRHYQFSGEQIAEMRVEETANVETLAALGELIILRTSGGEIRLFTDHNSRELTDLLVMIEAMLREGQWLAPVIKSPIRARSAAAPAAIPVVPADLEENAIATANRLLDRQRQVSDKLRPRE